MFNCFVATIIFLQSSFAPPPPSDKTYDYPTYSVAFPAEWQEDVIPEGIKRDFTAQMPGSNHTWILQKETGSTKTPIALASVFEDRTVRSGLEMKQTWKQLVKAFSRTLYGTANSTILYQGQNTINEKKVRYAALSSGNSPVLLLYCIEWPEKDDYRPCFLMFTVESAYFPILRNEFEKIVKTFESKDLPKSDEVDDADDEEDEEDED